MPKDQWESVHINYYKNRNHLCAREICPGKQRWFSKMYQMYFRNRRNLSASMVYETQKPLEQAGDQRLAKTDTRNEFGNLSFDYSPCITI